MKKIKVAIVVGSDSDLPIIVNTTKILEELNIAYSIAVASAHRTPDKVIKYVKDCENAGADVFIAAAGMAAALPGVVASKTLKPVIGLPIESKVLGGQDALFSIVQMPQGIPVATVAIGKAGAINAGVLAAQILAVKDNEILQKLISYRKKLANTVNEKNAKLQKVGIAKFIEQNTK